MEVFGYAISFFSFIITILAGVLTYQAWKNGRWMKQAHADTQTLIRETHEDTQALIRETHEDTQALIRETHKGTMELIAKIDKTIERLGELIVADGEKTRELVRHLR